MADILASYSPYLYSEILNYGEIYCVPSINYYNPETKLDKYSVDITIKYRRNIPYDEPKVIKMLNKENLLLFSCSGVCYIIKKFVYEGIYLDDYSNVTHIYGHCKKVARKYILSVKKVGIWPMFYSNTTTVLKY